LLDRAAALGPEGAAQADGRRAEILGRWLAGLAPRGDDAGIAIVYAAHTTEVHALASSADRVIVARALGRLGLHGAAVRVLGEPAERGSDPALELALAEEQLAAGDLDDARAALARVPEPSAASNRIAARVALAAGDLDAAAAAAALVDDPAVRADVAAALLARPDGAPAASALLQPVLSGGDVPIEVLLVAGAAAAAEGAWVPSADAYRRALAAGAAGAERLAAGAGLARAARERGDGAEARRALDGLTHADPAVARVARALVARQAARGR
jgi:hypothetical protein